jgi:hypothetical protein
MWVATVVSLPWWYSSHWYGTHAWAAAFIVLDGVVIAGTAIAVVVHELGHLAVGLAVGAKVTAFRVGGGRNALIRFKVRGFRVTLGWPSHGGVEYIAMPSVWRRTAITLAGSLADLVAAGVIAGLRLPVRHPVADVLALTIAVAGITNLLPFRTRDGRVSDGARLFLVPAAVRSQKTTADVAALTHGRRDVQDWDGARLSRVRAAYRKGDLVARANVGEIASGLRKAGKAAELLELHAGLTLPGPSAPVEHAAAIVVVELNVALLPGLPDESADLAEKRVDALLRYHDLGQSEPIAQFALALLRLRLRRYPDVERLCRPALALPATGSSPLSRQMVLGAVIAARKALGQPYEDLVTEVAGMRQGAAAAQVPVVAQKPAGRHRDAEKAAATIQEITDPGRAKRLLADLREFAGNPRGQAQPGRTDRLLAAYREGDQVAAHSAGYLGAMLQAEGRIAELLELHAGLAAPSGPRAGLLTRSMLMLEASVLRVAGLPAEAYELAATRVQWALDNHRLDGNGSPLRAATRHSLALARLRQGRFGEVEALCAEGLADTGLSAGSRAEVLATVVLARRALGQPHEELLARAISLDPEAHLVKEASAEARPS